MEQGLPKRLLLKLSGEALMGELGHGLAPVVLEKYAQDIVAVAQSGIQIAVVVGGGNFLRGSTIASPSLDRATADAMGMLATVMNALALGKAIEAANYPARVLSAVNMPTVCENYSRTRALDHLAQGRVVILAGGTGNPYFTTDTAAVLRAIELNCHEVLKATQVDGVYTDDPKKNPQAKRYDWLSYDEALTKDLRVMDTAAFALARENNMPLVVFALNNDKSIQEVSAGRGRYTRVSQQP